MDNHEELVAACVLYAFYSEVEHAMNDSDEIKHYGRIGMKWGQHIYGDDSRYSKLKSVARKARTALDSLDKQGDAVRERVNKFKTQTRAEANRWQMDNGYMRDPEKERRKAFARSDEQRRAEESNQDKKVLPFLQTMLGGGIGNRDITRSPAMIAGSWLRRASDRVKDGGRSLEAIQRASDQIFQRFGRQMPVDSYVSIYGKQPDLAQYCKKTSDTLVKGYRSAKDKLAKYEKVAERDNSGAMKRTIAQMYTVAGGMLDSAWKYQLSAETWGATISADDDIKSDYFASEQEQIMRRMGGYL